MGRLDSARFVLSLAMLLAGLTGCSSNSAVHTISYPIPDNITLLPTPAASMQVGSILSFTAVALNATKQTITEPLFYQSSDPTVVTIAANGLACAGSWNSLTNPQVCTAGRVGTAQISATAQGVTSPLTTVYVHQPIDRVTLSPAPNQQHVPCLSVNQSFI